MKPLKSQRGDISSETKKMLARFLHSSLTASMTWNPFGGLPYGFSFTMFL